MNDVTRSPAREKRFGDLVRVVIDPVRGYLFRRTDPATADDVLAETLSALWRRMDDIPEGAPIAWSIGVARLQLCNAERSVRRQRLLVERIVTFDPPEELSPPDSPNGSREDVERVLAAMTRREAELLRLWTWDELEPRQIAAVLNITPNAASIRLHRAKKKFEGLYRKDQEKFGHNQLTGGGGQ